MKYVLIIGAGKSGKAVCSKVASLGFLPVLFDDEYLELEQQVEWVQDAEFVIVSPSVRDNNKVIKMAKCLNKKVIGEIEFAYLNSLNLYNTIVGVTGTNGKTTVVSMLGHILKDGSLVAGNIGIPWTKCIGQEYENCILELSSFQLMTIDKFKPHIACILNLAPDHIDFHGSIEEYFNAKLNIFKNLTGADYCVLNAEDKLLMSMVKTTAQTIYFGFNNIKAGCFVKDDAIFIRIGGVEKFVIDLSLLKSSLRHNVMNVMAVVCIISKMVKNIYEYIYNFLSYEYCPYRMTDCGVVQDKKVFNDSKSTNVASTVSALKAVNDFKRVALIIGGKYKNESFKEIFEYENIEQVYLFGESSEIIKNEAVDLNYKKIKVFPNLELIIEDIFKHNNYDCLLFSPACASFDMYSSYIERGKHFDTLIEKYI